MEKYHNIEKITFQAGSLLLKVDGKDYAFQLSTISKKLASASSAEREKYEISPSGYGIYWPLIDEDLSIDGLLGIVHNPQCIREKASA